MNDAKTNASDHHIHFQNVFLTETQRREWLVANKYAHITLFASFVVFNLISVLTDRLALRHPSRRRLSSPPIDAKSIAQGAHGAAQLAHSILAVLAAAYAVSSRPSILDPTCTNPIFCFQQLPYTLLDIHAGYLFFEWAFYANHHDVLIPRFPLLFARRCLLLIAYALARVHPCTLTVATLPWYELLSAAQGAEGALDLSVAFRRPTKDKIKRLNTLVIFSCARAIGCFLIAVYSWWYLSSKGILQMEVRGSRGGLHAMYVLVWGGGAFILATIYLLWFRIVVVSLTRTKQKIAEATQRLREEREKKGGGGGGLAAPAPVAVAGSSKAKSKKKKTQHR